MSMLAEGCLESPYSLWTKHSINSLGLMELHENRVSYDPVRGRRGQVNFSNLESRAYLSHCQKVESPAPMFHRPF